jgi:hypothetical protein
VCFPADGRRQLPSRACRGALPPTAVGVFSLPRDRVQTSATRGGQQRALLPRTEDELGPYLARAICTATEPNAIGLFLHYHLAALGLATRWRNMPDDAVLAGQALATEAFALHFIEDSFSAGHVAGSWGSVDPGAPGPDLGNSWIIYLRLAFDARYYPW